MPKLADVEDPAPTAQAALPAAAGEQPAHGAAPAGDDSKPSPFAAAGPQSGVPAPGGTSAIRTPHFLILQLPLARTQSSISFACSVK